MTSAKHVHRSPRCALSKSPPLADVASDGCADTGGVEQLLQGLVNPERIESGFFKDFAVTGERDHGWLADPPRAPDGDSRDFIDLEDSVRRL